MCATQSAQCIREPWQSLFLSSLGVLGFFFVFCVFTSLVNDGGGVEDSTNRIAYASAMTTNG